LFIADHEESKEKLSLKQKIEKKIKENQEFTFENYNKNIYAPDEQFHNEGMILLNIF